MTLLIAAGFADISPRSPAPLAGSAGRHPPFVEIDAPLEANAVAFRDGNGRCAVIVTLDTLFVGAALQSALERHFVEAHGGKAEDLMVLASHTHYAPALDETKPSLGALDRGYLSLVSDRCKGLIDQVVSAPPSRVVLRRSGGSSHGAVNRRRSWPLPYLAGRRGLTFEAAMAPNPRGPIDHGITAWSLLAHDGTTVALLWHYTCHPTGLGRPTIVSPEFPGVVRQRLRQRFGSAAPILFLQGFAGDIRPSVPETRPLAQRAVKTMLFGPSFDSFSLEGWRQWANALADEVVNVFASPAPKEDDAANPARIVSALHAIPLSTIVAGNNPERPVRFQRLRLDPSLDIVAVAAEPLTGLKEFVPFSGTTLVGYLGDVFGYWPTDRDARRGGYEVSGYFRWFDLDGRLRPSLDKVFGSAMEPLGAPS
jgi:hypothetical protein